MSRLDPQTGQHKLIPVLKAFKEASTCIGTVKAKRIYSELQEVNAIQQLLDEYKLILARKSKLSLQYRQQIKSIAFEFQKGEDRFRSEETNSKLIKKK